MVNELFLSTSLANFMLNSLLSLCTEKAFLSNIHSLSRAKQLKPSNDDQWMMNDSENNFLLLN